MKQFRMDSNQPERQRRRTIVSSLFLSRRLSPIVCSFGGRRDANGVLFRRGDFGVGLTFVGTLHACRCVTLICTTYRQKYSCVDPFSYQ